MNQRIKEISINITIGVKSIGQIVVGTYFFIFLYNGSITSAKNFGLILSQNNWSQDKITSAKTIYVINLKNIKTGIIMFILF